jgi:NTP pyrophosphatase (non-canonical NTP hydrolase)
MGDLQRAVARFAERHDLQHDIETRALDIVAEVGELAKEILLATDYGRRPASFREALADEVGDVLYSLLALAEACGVDAEEALKASLGKYGRRLADRGEASSP